MSAVRHVREAERGRTAAMHHVRGSARTPRRERSAARCKGRCATKLSGREREDKKGPDSAGLSILFLLELVRVVIRAGFIRATLRDRLGTFHHKRAAEIADSSGRSRFDRVFAVGVI